MLVQISHFVQKLYDMVSTKGTLFNGPHVRLPLNGIYFFFEKGQKIMINGKEYNRIVRVGINEKQGNFRKRIRGHYKGNIEGSVFRENIGWALLERDGMKPREIYKTKRRYKQANSGGPLEEEISKYFSETLTFKAFAINHEKLAIYEEVLIGALSIYYQYKIRRKELNLDNWLGLHSYSRKDKIRRSGLWNSNHVVLVKCFTPLLFETKVNLSNFSTGFLNKVFTDLDQNIISAP